MSALIEDVRQDSHICFWIQSVVMLFWLKYRKKMWFLHRHVVEKWSYAYFNSLFISLCVFSDITPIL